MDTELDRLWGRAATIDELLSDAYQPVPGRKGDADLAGWRVAAWCRACAGGDWSLFGRRLRRDGLSFDDVLARFATVRRESSVPAPGWTADAAWLTTAVRGPGRVSQRGGRDEVAFEPLLAPIVREARTRLWAGVDAQASATLTDAARDDLDGALLTDLSALATPALYDRFVEARRGDIGYREFVRDMAATGWGDLFADLPVLLRLMASLTRQWLDSSTELVTRVAADLPAIRRELLSSDTTCRVASVESTLSDPHNFGRTVRVLRFEDGSRVVYKPKDLGADAAWAALTGTLNRSMPPVQLRATRVLPRPGYGWMEFVEHTSCDDPQDFPLFFRRAGAWLALFHAIVGVDMHQENIIAAGSHPVPVDLEMILQAADPRLDQEDAATAAFAAAMKKIIDSVLTVGLLPAYGRHSTSEVFVIGGVNSNTSPRARLRWADVNTDAMRPVREEAVAAITNLPYTDRHRARLGDHLDELITGFGDYARFLRRHDPRELLQNFAGTVIRKVIRPTRFYTGLLERLRDHRTMSDGVVWSAQADFAARLANWETDSDPAWPLLRAERAALVDLNVPHFTMAADLARAEARMRSLDDDEIAWQTELIEQNTGLLRRRSAQALRPAIVGATSAAAVFAAEADGLAAMLSTHAIREGSAAAWIGLDWLGDSEVSQLVVLGPDLYNGACGIALFLAAHAAVTGDASSAALARAALTALRHQLKGRNPARMARSLGLGGGLGLGSVIYGLSVIAELLDDDTVRDDAHAAARLITDDVLAADRRLDVLGGTAGAILGLLRLHRQTDSGIALALAEKCGRRLLTSDRIGREGARAWLAAGFRRPLNGMSHGASGYAYSLQALANATGIDEFAAAAAECIAYEDSTFDADRHGWADLRDMAGSEWPCKWCYGAPGIGLARIAMTKLAGMTMMSCVCDIDRALDGVERSWPPTTDTLCCGALGTIEFLREAGDALSRPDLSDAAARHLLSVVESARAAGDYRWSSGTSRFNLGLFRGLAGIGYTLLRALHPALPNVLIWE